MTKFKRGDKVGTLYTKECFEVADVFFNENKNENEPLYELSYEDNIKKNVFIFESQVENYKKKYHQR